MSNEHLRNGKYVKCETCGKEVYKKMSLLKRGNKHHFCSFQCQGIHKTKESSKIVECEFCHKEMILKKSEKKRFCCPECQHEWQKTCTGKKSPKYRQVKTDCTYCNREFYIQNYKKDNQNRFCSKECRQNWYANIWSQRQEWRDKSTERAIDLIASGKIARTYTEPHRKIVDLLEKMNVKYICEYPTKYYSIDVYLPESKLMIEVMGDFWHANPNKYVEAKYKNQKESIRRDAAKHTYVCNTYNVEILYLWESDIKDNLPLCRSLIETYISTCGRLDNYNSFNYILTEEKLTLKGEIIYPHFIKNIQSIKSVC